MVTVRGGFQLALVKVRREVETVPSAVLLDGTATVSFAVGWPVRMSGHAVRDALSIFTRPLVGLTLMPKVSLSVLVTVTSEAAKLLYVGSVLEAASVMME